MQDEITVSVFKRRGIYYAQYRVPISGNKFRKVRRSTGEKLKHKANKIAAAWEKDLNIGLNWSSGGILWEDFCERYEAEHLEGLTSRTLERSIGVLDGFEKIIQPRQLRDVNERALSKYQTAMRNDGRRPATIRSNLAHLRAAMGWALDQKLVAFLPQFPKVRRLDSSDVMKGRAIKLEEFERMLQAVESVILTPNLSKRKDAQRQPDHVRIPSWKCLLHGLWLSGLRLGEALELSWSDDTLIRVDLSGSHPMLRIPAAKEKGNKTRLMPITPDFGNFLFGFPKAKRRGFVFDPLPLLASHSKDESREIPRMQRTAVGKLISQIGEKAGVKVRTLEPKPGSDKPRVKFASAHDLRRSFGERWAYRVQPKLLQELMRHSKIETTMRYYVGLNAEKTAELLWSQFDEKSALGTNLGTTTDSGPIADSAETKIASVKTEAI